jgi:hypothetical protein
MFRNFEWSFSGSAEAVVGVMLAALVLAALIV